MGNLVGLLIAAGSPVWADTIPAKVEQYTFAPLIVSMPGITVDEPEPLWLLAVGLGLLGIRGML